MTCAWRCSRDFTRVVRLVLFATRLREVLRDAMDAVQHNLDLDQEHEISS